MKDVFSLLIQELNSSVFILLAMLVAVGYGLLKIGEWKEKFSQHETKLGRLDSMDKRLTEVATKVQLIYENTNPRSLARSSSPLALTKLGESISEKIDGVQIFERLRPALLEAMEKKCPQQTSAYDIQAAALDIAKTYLPTALSPEELNRVKDVAYQEGILVEDVWIIFGVYLRDLVLAHRQIPSIEIDRTDPTRQEN